ncbi:MAG: heavy-metal-associated domain-containing protein [Acetobacteraceae bacterium]|nr:heavy-metal-associated domain-containing protein [Acetobacteraceae bacterium]
MINTTSALGAAVFAPIAAGAPDCPAARNIEIAHHLPGRLRLRSPSLKSDIRVGEEAHRHLAQIEGVTSVTVNPCAGSLLLRYDPAVLPSEKVIEVLAAHGYSATAAEEGPEPRWANQLASAVTNWVIEALAERLVLALVGALA